MSTSGTIRLLFVGSLPPPVNGATVASELFVSALPKQGVELSVIDVRLSRSNDEYERVTVRKVFILIGLLLRFAVKCMFSRPNVVLLCPGFNPTSMRKDLLLARIAIDLFRLPTVFWCHGGGFGPMMKQVASGARRTNNRLFGRAKAVVLVADFFRKDFEGVVDPERLKVIHYGVEDLVVPPREERNGRVRVVYLSTMDPRKGWKELLVAAEVVLREHDAEFIFAGPAGNVGKEDIEEHFARHADNDRIRYIGPIYGDAKVDLLNSADIFCLPSAYPYEAFPVSIVEAMRSGSAIVGTKHAGIPEAFEDGKGGVLVGTNDPFELSAALDTLITGRKRLTDASAANRKRFKEQFTVEAFARKWVAVLNGLR